MEAADDGQQPVHAGSCMACRMMLTTRVWRQPLMTTRPPACEKSAAPAAGPVARISAGTILRDSTIRHT
jgi:hypothetical protein